MSRSAQSRVQERHLLQRVTGRGKIERIPPDQIADTSPAYALSHVLTAAVNAPSHSLTLVKIIYLTLTT